MPNILNRKRDFNNPVVETYRGVKVRLYNKLQIRVNQFELKKIIDAKMDEGMSMRDAIEKKVLFPCKGAVIAPMTHSYAQST